MALNPTGDMFNLSPFLIPAKLGAAPRGPSGAGQRGVRGQQITVRKINLLEVLIRI